MYKQPPKHRQFKPGQSGNPAGRPRNFDRLLNDLTSRLVRALVLAQVKDAVAAAKVARIKRILDEN